jgi:hypothetical protein
MRRKPQSPFPSGPSALDSKARAQVCSGRASVETLDKLGENDSPVGHELRTSESSYQLDLGWWNPLASRSIHSTAPGPESTRREKNFGCGSLRTTVAARFSLESAT